MEFTLLATYNVTVMFLMIGVGYFAFRRGFIQYDGAKQLANILIYIVTPCIILSSFQIDFDKSLASKLGLSAVLACIMHILGILLGKAAFRHLPYSPQSIYRYCTAIPNCGYMTLPLAYSLLGDVGVIYVSSYIAVTNFFTWTFGYPLLSGESESYSLKKAIINPGVISVIIAIPLFLFSIRIPPILLDPMKSLASINSPIAMVITGVFIAGSGVLSSFKDKYIYLVILLRQLLIPGIIGGIMILIRVLGGPVDDTVYYSSLLASAAPAAVSSSLFAAKCDADVSLASKTMALTTLYYIATISIMVFLSTLILNTL